MEIDGDHDFALFNKHFSRCSRIDYMTSAMVPHANDRSELHCSGLPSKSQTCLKEQCGPWGCYGS